MTALTREQSCDIREEVTGEETVTYIDILINTLFDLSPKKCTILRQMRR